MNPQTFSNLTKVRLFDLEIEGCKGVGNRDHADNLSEDM